MITRYWRLLGALLLAAWTPQAAAQKIHWAMVDTGLHVGVFTPANKSPVGDSEITVVKIDPRHYDFQLAEAKQRDGKRRTVEDWCKSEGFLAAVNAGMYSLKDGLTSDGYMKNGAFVNNPDFKPEYCSFLCFNPTAPGLPPVQIMELCAQTDPQWAAMNQQYGGIVQSIRMLNRQGANVWAPAPKMWSMVAWGMDKAGNVLWLFTRSPYTVHTFINILKQAPLNLHNLMYLEGGPPAALWLAHNGVQLRLVGSYETNVYEKDDNQRLKKLPNVIGIRKKAR